MKKKIYMCFGVVSMGIGTLGYILPVLPGTIFMIIAAFCFLRSNDRLYNKIVSHPAYGNSVRDYVEAGKIQFKAKIVILMSMWAATSVSVIYIDPHLYLNILTLILSIIGTVVVLRASH